jgi:hypothetical protein
MIEQLPPELAKLIAAEKLAPAADQALRTVVRAKLVASVAGAPLGAAAAGGLGIGKVLAIIAIVAGASTVAVVKSQHVSTSHPPSRAVVVAPTPIVAAHEVEPAPPPPAAPPVHAAAPIVPSQTELIQEAWKSLSAGDASHALELATRDARAHGNGALSEEREAVRIVSLAQLGRATEAASANANFTKQYPNSIHRELIDKALAGAP